MVFHAIQTYKLGCQRLYGHVSKTQHALSLFNVFLHCSKNPERPNPMFKYFKQKYQRCFDPNDETRSCFSIEHFSYDSDVVVNKGNLANHQQYWVAKNRRGQDLAIKNPETGEWLMYKKNKKKNTLKKENREKVLKEKRPRVSPLYTPYLPFRLKEQNY